MPSRFPMHLLCVSTDGGRGHTINVEHRRPIALEQLHLNKKYKESQVAFFQKTRLEPGTGALNLGCLSEAREMVMQSPRYRWRKKTNSVRNCLCQNRVHYVFSRTSTLRQTAAEYISEKHKQKTVPARDPAGNHTLVKRA